MSSSNTALVTECIYLEDPYKYSLSNATIVSIAQEPVLAPSKDQQQQQQPQQQKFILILDSTIFHPQGGGQVRTVIIIIIFNTI